MNAPELHGGHFILPKTLWLLQGTNFPHLAPSQQIHETHPKNMSFRSHIEIACKHLEKLGIAPQIREGTPVTEEQLVEAERVMQITLPAELRRYLKEMGDGFQLWYSAEPVTRNRKNEFCWMIDWLGDIVRVRHGMREDLTRNIAGESDSCVTDECKAESLKRMNWIPIFGIGGGGYTFCIDGNEGHGEIRYHDVRMSDGHYPSVFLATSIDDWMAKWSRFCFSEPLWDGTDEHGFLESYCWEMEGTFDWAASKFRKEFDRENEGRA